MERGKKCINNFVVKPLGKCQLEEQEDVRIILRNVLGEQVVRK
jgi:predicted DNA-binding antitoxin AbrB/MazE fold protein